MKKKIFTFILACLMVVGLVGTTAFAADYTVDFHHDEITYSIEGGTSILLQEVLDAVGYDEYADEDVVNATFSNEKLVKVENTKEGWLLTSLAPFDTEESLTLDFADGNQFVMLVTDANHTNLFPNVSGVNIYFSCTPDTGNHDFYAYLQEADGTAVATGFDGDVITSAWMGAHGNYWYELTDWHHAGNPNYTLESGAIFDASIHTVTLGAFLCGFSCDNDHYITIKRYPLGIFDDSDSVVKVNQTSEFVRKGDTKMRTVEVYVNGVLYESKEVLFPDRDDPGNLNNRQGHLYESDINVTPQSGYELDTTKGGGDGIEAITDTKEHSLYTEYLGTGTYKIYLIYKYTVKGSFDGGHGTVTNNNQTGIAYNTNCQSMVFTPANGYKITGVTVNGTPDTTFTATGYTYPAQAITEDKTVVASTAPIDYTITYDPNGGTLAGPSTQTYNVETDLKLQAAASKTGYTFTNWKVKETSGAWTADATFDAEGTVGTGKYGDVTLVAQYTAKKDVSYKVKYVEKDTNPAVEIATAKEVKDRTFDSEVKEDAIDVTGFTKVDPTSQTFKLDAYNKEIIFYYTRNEYEVSYSYDGVTPKDASAVPTTANHKFEEEVTVAADATGTGYTFNGWTTADATVTGGKFNMPADDVAFVGMWTAKNDVSYKVKYMEQGTTTEIATANEVKNKTFDTTVKENAIDVPGFTAVDPTSQEMVLDAYNKEIIFYYTRNEYEVSYSYDGVTPKDASAVPTAANHKFEEEVTVAANATGTGYTFNGWTTADATVTGGKFNMPADDVAFVGTWTAKNDVSYKVKYMEQGTTTEIATAKEVKNRTFDTTVKENAIDVPGFTAVDPTSQEMVLDAYNKEIIFYYTRNSYEYTIKHVEKDADPENLLDEVTGTALYGTDVEVKTKDFEGFSYDSKTSEDITIGLEDNEATVYYKRNSYKYTIIIEDAETGEIIKKEVDEAEYEDIVKATTEPIEGFTPETQGEKELKIGTDEDKNVIVFKYKRNAHKVSYKFEGDVHPAHEPVIETKEYKYEAKVTVEADPKMNGYVFSGWKTKDVTVTNGKFSMPDKDVEFVGTWTKSDKPVTGDQNNATMYIILAAGCAVLIAGALVLVLRKKKEN